MRHHHILATIPTVPLAESVVAALQEAEQLVTLIQVRYWGLAGSIIELAVAPKGTRVMIDISGDLQEDRDIDTSTHESVEALVDEREHRSIRRVIIVRHWDHADAKTISRLLDHLCSVTEGTLVQESLESGRAEE
jgi:hypothetical protein